MSASKPTVGLVLLLGLSGSLAHAGFDPGQRTMGVTGAPGGDPFRFTFDEQGNGFVQTFNPVTGQYGPAVNNPGFIDPATGFLTFRLPEFVVPGSVLIRGGPDEPANS